jgi:FkbM family methyltransferase
MRTATIEAKAKQALQLDGDDCWLMDSFWLRTDPDDHGFTPHVRTWGIWEPNVTLWLLNQFPGHAFMDVGANQGYYGLLAASRRVPTLMFEPQPLLVYRLQHSLVRNNFMMRPQVVQVAVGKEPGTATFTVPKHHPMLATYAYDVRSPEHPNDSYHTYPVEVRPLDWYATWYAELPLLVKLDVEGAEPEAWAGMYQLFRRKRPTTVVLEFRADRYQNAAAFAAELLRAGALSTIDEHGLEVPTTAETLLARPDYDWMVVVRPTL